MTNDYRIESAGSAFILIDDADEQVNTYRTEDAAKKDLERCKREDAMWESAKFLVDIAIKTHMEMYGVDRDTARYWINSAMGGA
jgi:hypothetical protein